MKDNFYIFLDQIRVSFERIKPANEEFLAMVGLVLCSSGGLSKYCDNSRV